MMRYSRFFMLIVVLLAFHPESARSESHMMPQDKERSFPCAAIFLRDDSDKVEWDGPDSGKAPVFSLPAPSVRYALWPDGTFIWSERYATGGVGPRYLIGTVSREDLRAFYLEIENSLTLHSEGRNRSAFGPHAARMVVAVSGVSLPIYMQSVHESHDGTNGTIATEGGVRPLKAGETREQVEASWSEDQRAYRALWQNVNNGFKMLVERAQVQSMSAEEIFTKLRRMDYGTVSLLAAEPTASASDNVTTGTMSAPEKK